MTIETKYRCPICGFESNGAGECPTCDEPMQKLCLCGSGEYSTACCQLQNKPAEDDRAAQADVSADILEEKIKEAEIVADEDDEDAAESKKEDF